jgi:hypothetical protein
MRRRLGVLTALYALLLAPPASGQQGAAPLKDSTVAVRLHDGSLLVGHLVEQTADSVRLVTGSGRMTLARNAITELKAVRASDVHDGAYWQPDPHDTRMFFGPTGRVLDKGGGYFSDLYLFFVNAAWGVTDRFMLGGGMSVFSTSDFFGNNLYYVTPKFALVRGESFNVSAGALVGFTGHTNGSAGIYYVAATSGRPGASLTYGVGYAYVNADISGDATLLLGGEVRVSRRVALMSENYVFTGSAGGYVLPIYGFRFIGDKLSTDFGFVNYLGHGSNGVWPGLPWVGIAFRF